MENIDKIITIEEFHEYKFKEKASQFIGQVFHCESEDEAKEILERVKKEFYDARHHCYCWKIGEDTIKYSDDGEPNGTAGIRILNAIEHFNLQNIIVISIRYFGGVKLGVGPLGKAYYNSAYNCLDEANKIEKIKYQYLRVKFGYDFTSKIHHYLGMYNAIIKDNLYEDNPVIEFLLRPDQVEKFCEEIFESTHGRVKVEPTKNIVLI
ncbi:MAG: YigZ family protein [Rhodothermaceae bacterium]